MKKITSVVLAAAAALGLNACNQKTADTVQEKADDAKQAVEAKTEEAKAEN